MGHRNVIRINSNGIEVLVTTLLLSDSYSLQLVLLYRSPSMSLQCLINTLIDLFNQIDPVVPTILMGDFNVDLNENPTHLIRFMSNNGYDQLMDSPTTDRGTIIFTVIYILILAILLLILPIVTNLTMTHFCALFLCEHLVW